ncbi:helix-turn-helix domain-containing protein [Shimia sp.]|uniref:helix-turn-helix domain-containing protein n=1 Tax=Shimia sp. TaxID=1954381 RepID=UPI003565B4A1
MFELDADEGPEGGDSPDLLELFRFNTDRLLKQQKWTRSELSRMAGYKTNKATDILDGTALPNISVAVNFARAFNVPMDELFKPCRFETTELVIEPLQEIDRQSSQLLNAVFQAAHKKMVGLGERPSIDTIMAWWQESGGRFEDCDRLTPHIDVVSVPGADQRLPEVRHMGAMSLSAQTLKSRDSERLASFMRTLNEADQEELRRCVTTVSYTKTGLVTPQTRIVDMPGMACPVEISFIRLMLPITDANNTPYVLNFSTLLSESELRNKSGFLQ